MKHFLTYLLLITNIIICNSQSLPDTLIGYYPANGNYLDYSKNLYYGVPQSTSFESDRFNTPSSTFSFNGTNSYIQIPNILGRGNSISFSAWVFAPPYAGSGWPQFISSTTTASHLNTGMGIWQNTNHLHMEVQTTNGNFPMEGSLEIPWNSWFHVVMVYDGTYLTEYLNGIKGKSIAASGSLLATTDVTIGSSYGAGNFFLGRLDDLKIFSKALNEWEILTLLRNSTCNTPWAQYLLAGNARDTSGTKFHGIN